MKSPKSPRQLPQLPIAGQRSPVSSIKSPNSSSRVFEFPSSCSDGPKCSKFDFDDFASSQELSRSKSPSCSGISGMKSPRSNISISPGQESPVFQFCNPKKIINKTMSYPPKSPVSPGITHRSPSSISFGQKSPKPFAGRRNSCFNFGPKSPMSPTIVMTSGHSPTSPGYEMEAKSTGKIGGKVWGPGKRFSSFNEKDREHYKRMRNRLACQSQGCLNETENERNIDNVKSEKNIARRSTSDLTEMNDAETEVTLLSSPRRRGSMKGGLGEDSNSFFFLNKYFLFITQLIKFLPNQKFKIIPNQS